MLLQTSDIVTSPRDSKPQSRTSKFLSLQNGIGVLYIDCICFYAIAMPVKMNRGPLLVIGCTDYTPTDLDCSAWLVFQSKSMLNYTNNSSQPARPLYKLVLLVYITGWDNLHSKFQEIHVCIYGPLKNSISHTNNNYKHISETYSQYNIYPT